MKIIHTSDLHLGKKIEGKSRLPEQAEVLDELIGIVKEQKVDCVVIAGDVFDTVNPPADAESLFYSKCLEISRCCPVLAIAGNHDNPDRLSAPVGIAGECGIVLCGNLDLARQKAPFSGGEGFVRLVKKGENVNFACLPYPSAARMSALGYAQKEDKKYCEYVKDWLNICARGFTASDCNITVSHLFMAGSVKASDEIELGTAAILPVDILPSAHYTALGHIHKPQCVSKSKNVYYSGSILSYSFDDTSEKFFNLLETSPAGVKVTKLPIASGKKLITARVNSYDDCLKTLNDNIDAFVRIEYDCAEPLTSSKYAELRAYPSFCLLKNVYEPPKSERKAVKFDTDEEYFTAYYKATRKEEPSKELLELFGKAMRGEEL